MYQMAALLAPCPIGRGAFTSGKRSPCICSAASRIPAQKATSVQSVRVRMTDYPSQRKSASALESSADQFPLRAGDHYIVGHGGQKVGIVMCTLGKASV